MSKFKIKVARIEAVAVEPLGEGAAVAGGHEPAPKQGALARCPRDAPLAIFLFHRRTGRNLGSPEEGYLKDIGRTIV